MSCSDAKAWEKRFFDPLRNDGTSEIPQESDFVQRAGTGICESLPLSKTQIASAKRILVLVGKGHNGADALVVAKTFMDWCREEQIFLSLIFFAEKWDDLSPITMDAYEALLREHEKPPSFFLTESSVPALKNFCVKYEGCAGIVIDGIYGHGFHPPMPEHVFKALVYINDISRESVRIAVDLPSGLSDSGYTHYAFIADYTCATGIVKNPVLSPRNSKYVGKVIPVGIGFPVVNESLCAVESGDVLSLIPETRPTFCDKRDFGHLVVVGGSRNMPGALMLNVLAALRAGAGLVTVFCPESVHAAFAARAPAAMWVPCKETPEGALDCDDVLEKLRPFFSKANTILCGSGMGISESVQKLIRTIAKECPENIALIFDADALRKETLSSLRERGENILLPHSGEYFRMGGEENLEREFCGNNRVKIALKGPYTRVCNAEKTLVTFAGTPALARGGSGDLLAGTVAALFASRDGEFEKIAFNGVSLNLLLAAVVWHGAAAEKLAIDEGIRNSDITHLVNYFSAALQSPSICQK